MVLVGVGVGCVIAFYVIAWGQFMGGNGTAQLEQRIHGVIVKCRGRVDARCGARTILCVMGLGRGVGNV